MSNFNKKLHFEKTSTGVTVKVKDDFGEVTPEIYLSDNNVDTLVETGTPPR